MMTVVLRAFGGPDGRLIPGQLVDSSGWKNESYLLDQHYLRSATEYEVTHAEEVEVEEPQSRLPRVKKNTKKK